MIVINAHTREACVLIQQYNNVSIEFIEGYASAESILLALNLCYEDLEVVSSHNKLMRKSTLLLEPAGVYQLVLINDEIDFWDWYSDEALAVARDSMLRMSNYMKARRILKDIMDAPDAVDKLPRIVNQLIAARQYKDGITKDDASLYVYRQIADKLKERDLYKYKHALIICYELAGEHVA